MRIKALIGREIYDSRAMPTIECDLVLEDDTILCASVPNGASCGTYEAHVLHDEGQRFQGKSVERAVDVIEKKIAPLLIGQLPELVGMDAQLLELDGTHDKSNLGANTMLAVSMAVCRAQAWIEDLEPYELMACLSDFETISIPMPLFNVVNGGVHGSKGLAVQEYLMVPVGAPDFRTALEAGIIFAQAVRSLLQKKGQLVGYGDEGGASAVFADDDEAVDLLMEVIENTTDQLDGITPMIAIDAAAGMWYDVNTSRYHWRGKRVDIEDLISWYEQLAARCPLYSIEDGAHYDDWRGWQLLHGRLGMKVNLIGDDIFATQANRVWLAKEHGLKLGTVLKPNQVGTVTEALQTAKLCKDLDLITVASHRSGETNDDFIAEFAAGISATHIKAGAPFHGERLAKYLRLLTIEDTLLWQIEADE